MANLLLKSIAVAAVCTSIPVEVQGVKLNLKLKKMFSSGFRMHILAEPDRRPETWEEIILDIYRKNNPGLSWEEIVAKYRKNNPGLSENTFDGVADQSDLLHNIPPQFIALQRPGTTTPHDAEDDDDDDAESVVEEDDVDDPYLEMQSLRDWSRGKGN